MSSSLAWVTGMELVAVSGPPLPAKLEAAVRSARFLPALIGGRPVDSTGTFALSELFTP